MSDRNFWIIVPVLVTVTFMGFAGCGGPTDTPDAGDAVITDISGDPGNSTWDIECPTDSMDDIEAEQDVTDSQELTDIPGDANDLGHDSTNNSEIFETVQDKEYLQEFNHTGIEVDTRITNIVDILVRPAWAPAIFEELVIVTTGGYWVRNAPISNPEAVEGSRLVGADEKYGSVVGAGFGPDGIYLVQQDAIFRFDGTDEHPEFPLKESETPFTTVNYAYDWTLVTSETEILAITPDGIINLGQFSDENDTVTSATVNSDHSYLYVATSSPDGSSTISKWKITQNTVGTEPEVSLPNNDFTVQAMISDITVPEQTELVVVTDQGIFTPIFNLPSARNKPNAIFDNGRVPLSGAKDIAKTADGGFVIATEGGAIRVLDRGDGPEWRVYNTLRWVADNDVRAVATTHEAPDSPIYLGSAAGLTWTTVERMTLEHKMDLLREKIELRHDRDGAVADSRLMVAGDLSTSIPWDSDNDGGWTCYWVISECMRWLETGDEGAKSNFDRSLQAMLNLRLLTGEDWFLARSLIRIDGCQLDDCDNPDDGEWYVSPDGEWWVKSDTSNDEVTSHMFMMGPAYDLCADESQKQAIREHVSNIIGGIIDHGYQLWKPTGECTTYGQFDPDYMTLAVPFADGGRRSAQILAGLNLAYYMTGDQKFMDAKNYLIDEHNYAENVMSSTEPPGRMGSGDGDELSMQAFFILVQYESDPELKSMWLQEWADIYENLKTQQDTLWDTVQGVLTGSIPDMNPGERFLRMYPIDQIRWPMHNNHRLDLIPAPDYYTTLPDYKNRFMRSDGRIIPSDERPNHRHNGPQFQIEGGWGANREMDSADIQSAYWISRHYGFISAP